MQKTTKNNDFPDVSVFPHHILHDMYPPSIRSIKTNRDFDLYNFPGLEASALNSDKDRYRMHHFVKDLGFFCRFLTLEECNYIVHVFFWLMREAMKNYGFITIDNFGRFTTIDTVREVKYNVATNKRYTSPYFKQSRKIVFTPSKALSSLITPRNMRYMSLTSGKENKELWPNLFEGFVYEKKHRRLGQLLVQEAINKQFVNIPYSRDYLRALVTREILDNTLYI